MSYGRIAAVVFIACCAAQAGAQQLGAPVHPSLVDGVEAGRAALHERVARDGAAARQLEAIIARVQPYVERHRRDPAWITSRLQMYWQDRHTQVYVKNGLYDHADGQAPVPTVRFTGARDTATAYATPALEDVKPYMGEGDRLYLQNKNLPGQPWEWAQQPKTGRIIESINMRIAELARDAAFLYWYDGDEAYARFAFDIFDTYVSGIAYRKMPVDLAHGHDQTLVGLQSFEVIHEDIIGPLAEVGDFINAYVARRAGPKQALYDTAFKQWADVIIANGVPWNNWNLIQARFVLHIAAILAPDASYADGRGSGHYVRAVIDGSGARQWSLQRLLDAGYDRKTAMWNESPGYSNNVANDYMECIDLLDRVFGIDLLARMPILPRVAGALPQYLLPNGRTVGFGDTHYAELRTDAIERLLAHAARHGQHAQQQDYAGLLAAVRKAGAASGQGNDRVHALLAPVAAAPVAAAAPRIEAYQSPTFFAPNASWLIQRNGYDSAATRQDAMAISQAGSNGNHAHANGIAMELYAKGLSLAPESGRGSGYFQNDYAEYYAQFPAHNTVVVDGRSTYAPMKSNHPLSLQALYPQPGSPAAAAFPLATFSDASFIEPETDAQQRRVLGTVRLDDQHGYFIDIFRSRRRDGQDQYHDYIYHNLGQSMRFTTPAGLALASMPASGLSFADGDLIGYDYWWDRKALTSERPLKASFALALPGRAVSMDLWLQGSAKRQFYSVQAPPSMAWSAGMLPAEVDRLPLQTLVIRQQGEAWSHPFAVVMEAADGAAASVTGVEEIFAPGSAGHGLALRVSSAGARHQTIISNDADDVTFTHAGLRLRGRYGIVAERDGALDYLFLGHGRAIARQDYAILARRDGTAAALWQESGQWRYSASGPARLSVPAHGWPQDLALEVGGKTITVHGRGARAQGRPVRVFDMPPMAAGRLR